MTQCLAADDRFDVVVANPPLLPGEAPDTFSRSIFDPGLHATIDFIGAIGRHLKPTVRCYLVTSNVMERYGYDVDRLCLEAGLSSYVAAKRDVCYETYRVHEIKLDQTPR
jgi:methylase of polypeptide subunit release factors